MRIAGHHRRWQWKCCEPGLEKWDTEMLCSIYMYSAKLEEQFKKSICNPRPHPHPIDPNHA